MGKAADIVLLFVEVKNADVTQERAEMQHECSIVRRIVESKMSDLRVSNKSDDGFKNNSIVLETTRVVKVSFVWRNRMN